MLADSKTKSLRNISVVTEPVTKFQAECGTNQTTSREPSATFCQACLILPISSSYNHDILMIAIPRLAALTAPKPPVGFRKLRRRPCMRFQKQGPMPASLVQRHTENPEQTLNSKYPSNLKRNLCTIPKTARNLQARRKQVVLTRNHPITLRMLLKPHIRNPQTLHP